MKTLSLPIHFVYLANVISFLHHLRSFGTYTLT